MPRLEILNRSDPFAEYIVYDDNGKEVKHVHRDISEEIDTARRRHTTLLEAIARTEQLPILTNVESLEVPGEPYQPMLVPAQYIEHHHDSDYAGRSHSHPPNIPVHSHPDAQHDKLHNAIETTLMTLAGRLEVVLDRLQQAENHIHDYAPVRHYHDPPDLTHSHGQFDEIRGIVNGYSTVVEQTTRTLKMVADQLSIHDHPQPAPPPAHNHRWRYLNDKVISGRPWRFYSCEDCQATELRYQPVANP
jgi:hypothetical protein